MRENRWDLLRVCLNEGRYHGSACMVQDRYIYVFGGYRTKKLAREPTTSPRGTSKISRADEVMVPVTSGRIERYDTSKSPNAWNAVINRAGQANRSHMPA